jgi:hypothetical protein
MANMPFSGNHPQHFLRGGYGFIVFNILGKIVLHRGLGITQALSLHPGNYN